jgi:Glycosyl transferase family 2
LNQAQFLEQTLRSVLEQNYDNLEYVVVDGGSDDGSTEIIKRYSSQLAYWVSERDNGHGNAINKDFARTSGEIMAWLNSDDMYFPWTLRTVAEIFTSHPEINWITGINMFWDAQGRIINAYRNLKNKYDFLLNRYAWIQQVSTFWRRSLWDTVGGTLNEDYSFMVDGELWTRFFLRDRLHHVSCALGGYRMWGGNRAAHNMDACHTEMRQCISTMRSECDPITLSHVSKLRRISRLGSIMRGLPVTGAARRIMPALLANVGYVS